MSESKFSMVKKLARVQEKLMSMPIEDTNLDGILPLIFKCCREENLMFWFNFIEDAVVLNLRDIRHENYELNIRYAYERAPIDEKSLEYYKTNVLVNAFLLLNNCITLQKNNDDLEKEDVASSETSKENEEEPLIISGDKPVPKHINDAIEKIKAKGIPVTAQAIHNHLPLGQMSTSARLECNKYLKEMEVSQ